METPHGHRACCPKATPPEAPARIDLDRRVLAVGSLPPPTPGLAREVGRHLAALHTIDVMEAVAFLGVDDDPLRGDALAGDPL